MAFLSGQPYNYVIITPENRVICADSFFKHVGKFLRLNWHIHNQNNLFTHSSNHWNLIRYFLTLTLPHSRANLCETEASRSQRQCIIPATLAGSAAKDNIRSARVNRRVNLSVIPLSPSFVRAVAPSSFGGAWVQSALLQGFLPAGLNWIEWERSLQFSKKAWGWILL